MQVTLDWITHKPKTNAYFCAIHASVKVVKMNKTIQKNICLLEKTLKPLNQNIYVIRRAKFFTIFPSAEGDNLIFN